jgi:hypothetical protein
MKPRLRDITVLSFVEKGMPDATFEEKMKCSQQFWLYFDAWWAVAERITKEEAEGVNNIDKDSKGGSLK